ncbi:hypothetical protein [Streptomyces sp. NPDC047000]|uniref:hypothetical protein n=1 Tax=Streptomyces sp. NPDC047000 TaxID=3155474 RepID=UPI0033C6E6C4
MTHSGQGERPSARPAREGIVLPSDGSEPLLPGTMPEPPVDRQPPAGQAWGQPWGPEQRYPHTAPDPQTQIWPEQSALTWGSSDPEPQHHPHTPAPVSGGWGGGPGALPPEAPAPQAPAYGYPPVAGADEGATQYIPPVPAGQAYGAPADEGATQYIPPVPAGGVPEGATQLLPPVTPGALPPEISGAASPPGAAHPDAEPTQYISPVPAGPYGGETQPPAEFDNLFRSDSGSGAAGGTPQMPRVQRNAPGGQQPYGRAPYAEPSYAPHGAPQGPGDSGGRGAGRGGRGGDGGSRSRVPLIAAIGIGIVVIGIGAGALMGGGGGGGGDDTNGKPVADTAAASDGASQQGADPVKQQAVALDKLLADSGNSRTSVINAVADVKRCDNLDGAASDLRAAAKQRTQLVTRLSQLSVDKLPNNAALASALTKAWQASASADSHYANWADQVAANRKGCHKGQARTTGETQAGNVASGTASTQKTEAAQLWNPIAKQYGLTQRERTQL